MTLTLIANYQSMKSLESNAYQQITAGYFLLLQVNTPLVCCLCSSLLALKRLVKADGSKNEKFSQAKTRVKNDNSKASKS